MLTWRKNRTDLLLDLKVCIYTDMFIGTLSCYGAHCPHVFVCVSTPALYKDSNFTWANAGATVFGAAVAPGTRSKHCEEGSDEEEVPVNVEIHFEPIVSLPEVPRNNQKREERSVGESKWLLNAPHPRVPSGGDKVRGGGRGDPV